MLQLTRPIAFFDLETTGVNLSTDRIVEIAILKIMTDGTEQKKRKLINPLIPIPKEASDIHGITNEMIKDAPTFADVANEIKQFIEGCDLGGYNSNRFDIPLLADELLRVGLEVDLSERKFIDVQHIFYKMEPRTLTAAYKFYCNKDLEGAHGAEADIAATYEVLNAQLGRYTNLGNSIPSILSVIGEEEIVDYARRFIYNEKKEVIFNFGKHKGKTLLSIFKSEPGYYDWMMKGDFALHTKMKMTEVYNEYKLSNLKK